MPQLSMRVREERIGHQNSLVSPTPTAASPAERDKAVKILAKSIYREFKSQGFDARQIVSLATELIANVTTDLKDVSPGK
jgi:hypothetical protein